MPANGWLSLGFAAWGEPTQYLGDDNEIDIANPGGGHDPEFAEWRWEPMKNLPDLIVPFKRKVYERVVSEFAKFART